MTWNGHAKQGAAFDHTKIQGKSLLVRGLNALAAPVIAATRLRDGNAGSSRGATSLAAELVGTTHATGCTGTGARSSPHRPASNPTGITEYLQITSPGRQ